MATEAIISDVGTIYKRLFHHRPVIQNEVHLFVREFEVKRGNSDLQCLQSCVSMVSEMEAVFLEDIASMRPHFKSIHSLAAEVTELGNEILGKEKEDTGVSPSEQERLNREVEEYRLEQERETAECEARAKSERQRLGLEIRETRDSRLRLRTVSVGSSAGLSLSLNGSPSDSVEGEGRKGEDEEE
ncbi:Biogenesis of lysosome-related organelles complex 1 subunit 5, partial [Geodia barretti]